MLFRSDEGFDADGRGLAVVGDLLMGDLDVIEIFQCLTGFAQGQAKVDMQRQAQRHTIWIHNCVFFSYTLSKI